MHITLLGSSGYVGSVFSHAIKRRGYKLSHVSRKNCDLYSTDSLKRHLGSLGPDIVINCAGYTGKPNVDACELDKKNCLNGNAVLPGIIRDACKDLAIPWGHVSSGCIFTGTRPDGSGFTEDDEPNFSFRQNNCSFYSGTKALGEEILQGAKSCFIWRLRIPFSNADSNRNYISKLLHYDTLLEAENSLSELDEFVAAALDCFELNLPFGIYNLTNPGSIKTSEAASILQETIASHRKFRFFESEDQFMQLAANTPRSNCILDSSKAVNAGLKLTTVHDAFRNALQNWTTSATKSN